jgi:hypothetical protein
MDLQGVCAVESVKDLTFFHTKLKSPVPVYGRTGLVTSILCHLIGPICCFKVMENNFVWGRLFSGLKWQKIGSKVITEVRPPEGEGRDETSSRRLGPVYPPVSLPD